jgi:hypothetical protein
MPAGQAQDSPETRTISPLFGGSTRGLSAIGAKSNADDHLIMASAELNSQTFL